MSGLNFCLFELCHHSSLLSQQVYSNITETRGHIWFRVFIHSLHIFYFSVRQFPKHTTVFYFFLCFFFFVSFLRASGFSHFSMFSNSTWRDLKPGRVRKSIIVYILSALITLKITLNDVAWKIVFLCSKQVNKMQKHFLFSENEKKQTLLTENLKMW